MKTHDLYGIAENNLEAARAAIETALGIKMIPHESHFMGDYYLSKNALGESFRLQKNYDPLDGEPRERDFPEAGILLYVDGTDRANDIEQVLSIRIRKLFLIKRTRI